ncbi:MAG: DUF5995 family protein [Bacteroidia bacterium]
MDRNLHTIDDVLEELDLIIARELQANSPIGIFAYAYRRTTSAIKQAVLEKRFEDNSRMALFDIVFAELYLDAYYNYVEDRPVRLCWQRSFEPSHKDLSIVQHLMLGMNAHINLDLGIAVSAFSAGGDLQALKNDFFTVNLILLGLVNEIQRRVGKVSRLMVLLDLIGHRTDEKLMGFSMIKARQCAWDLACDLFPLCNAEQEQRIIQADETYARLADKMINPGFLPLNLALKLITHFEEKDMREVIATLQE